MCGITGIMSFSIEGGEQLAYLEKATQALEKRGPDVHGTWLDKTTGLGHRRLSIIDVSPQSNQPFHDSTGRYTLVFNGELYNYRELRKELLVSGVNFKTTGDTEVVMEAFKAYGTKCFALFNGFFALAIYDKNLQLLFLSRDRFGIKPFYYYYDDDKFLFASELKALLNYNVVKKLNHEALFNYFRFTYVPDNQSILEGIRKLSPGHYALVRHGKVEINAYYRPKININHDWDRQSAQKRVIHLMQNSISQRLIADVPVGIFLSGGIDSSVIVALASRQTSQLKTFSIGFKGNKYFDESNYAQLVADKFKTVHTVFHLTNDDLINHVEEIVNYIDEPFADSSAIPFYILSKCVKDQIKVALSGDGADEIFSGYNKHAAWSMSFEKTILNQMVKSGEWLWKVLPKSRYLKITDRIRQLEKYGRVLNKDPVSKYWEITAFFGYNDISRLLKCGNPISPLLESVPKSNDINEVLLADLNWVLPGDMLRKVDMMSMANGLEVRVPFLDHNIVDFAFQLHGRYKISGQDRKKILRESFREILPKELYFRAKHGFEVPIMDWFKKELEGELSEYVFNKERIEDQGLFNWKEIQRIKQKMYSVDPSDVHVQVWSLYVFQKWYGKYFLS